MASGWLMAGVVVFQPQTADARKRYSITIWRIQAQLDEHKYIQARQL